MKKILIINIGGTIAMSEDQTTGKVSPTSENPLTNQGQYFKQLAH
ncbi:asparaginase domain-containing protein [Globicatella sulfidifaciens]|nr:asparaginase domain-containing protein [Globicatella sulfidifaciens]